MTVIKNPKALDVILEHLNRCHSFAEQLIENDALIEHEKINPILRHIETNRNLILFLIDKYMNLEEPKIVRDIFRTYLHTGYHLMHLQNNPTLNEAEALTIKFRRLIDAIKE